VYLGDPQQSTNGWQIDGLGFSFPTNAAIAAHGFFLLTRGDPEAFRARHAIPRDIPIEQYPGALDNHEEWLRLLAPDMATAKGTPYYPVDEVRYSSQAPWPTLGSAGNASLHRLDLTAYANDPANWRADAASPDAPYTAGKPLIDLRIQLDPSDSQPILSLFVESQRALVVQYAESLITPSWFTLTNLPAALTNRTESFRDPTRHSTRFYRVASPDAP
jgi:hypothetical protein